MILRSLRNSSPEPCAKECGKLKNCRGFMYNTSNKNCWLKTRLRNEGKYGRQKSGVGNSYIKKQPYKCYHWSNQDRAEFSKRGASIDVQREVCESQPNRIFTRGDNKYYPGGSTCWCVQDGDRTKKEQTCGKLYMKKIKSNSNINLMDNKEQELASYLPNDLKDKNTKTNEFLDVQNCEQYRIKDPFLYFLCMWINQYFKKILGNNGEINRWDNLTLKNNFATNDKQLPDLQGLVYFIFNQKEKYKKWVEEQKKNNRWMREGFENEGDDSQVTKLIIVIAIVLILYFALMFLKK